MSYIMVWCVVFLSVCLYERVLSMCMHIEGFLSMCVCVADRKDVLSLEKLEAQLKACLRCMSFSKAKVGSLLHTTTLSPHSGYCV